MSHLYQCHSCTQYRAKSSKFTPSQINISTFTYLLCCIFLAMLHHCRRLRTVCDHSISAWRRRDSNRCTWTWRNREAASLRLIGLFREKRVAPIGPAYRITTFQGGGCRRMSPTVWLLGGANEWIMIHSGISYVRNCRNVAIIFYVFVLVFIRGYKVYKPESSTAADRDVNDFATMLIKKRLTWRPAPWR